SSMHHLSHFFFFFNTPTTTYTYTLSLHDALPIFSSQQRQTGSATWPAALADACRRRRAFRADRPAAPSRRGARSCLPPRTKRSRSEEHTSELQSLAYLVCRLLLEKKKKYEVKTKQ